MLTRDDGCPNIYVQTILLKHLCEILSSAVEITYCQRHFSAVSHFSTLLPGIVLIALSHRARLSNAIVYLFIYINCQSLPGLSIYTELIWSKK